MEKIKNADWKEPSNIKQTFSSADILGKGSNRVVLLKLETMKYKVIKSMKQYNEYCERLEALVFVDDRSQEIQDEIELLTLLIEKYDQETKIFSSVDPIRLLKSLMEDHNLSAKDLVKILGVSKGLVSDILNYKKGLSKEVIRKLSAHFGMNQEAFNRFYKLKVTSAKFKNAGVMNTKKKLGFA